MTTAGPIDNEDRIGVVDTLRGFALFGILLINITAFLSPGGPPGIAVDGSPLDHLVYQALILFVESKFFSLFSFLFGLGFSFQMLRSGQHAARFVPRFTRRLSGLLLFGIAHVLLLWEGDILLLYALVGFLLLLFRKTQPRKLLIWVSLLLLIPLTLFAIGLSSIEVARHVNGLAARLRQADSEFINAIREGRAAALHLSGEGTYKEMLFERVVSYRGVFLLLLSRVPTVLAMFLLGLYVGRRDIMQHVSEHLPLLRKVRRWGLSLGLLTSLLITIAYTRLPPVSAILALFFNQALAGPLLAMGYAATLILLVQSPKWQRRLHPLESTGRMALTNYLMQSLICGFIFFGFGFGLAGKIGPAAALLMAAGIYGAQILISICWLRHFRFGPMEWLWKCLTYLKLQPLRWSAER